MTSFFDGRRRFRGAFVEDFWIRLRKEEDFIRRLSFFVFANALVEEVVVVLCSGRAMRPEPERGFEEVVLVRIEGRFLGAVGALKRGLVGERIG